MTTIRTSDGHERELPHPGLSDDELRIIAYLEWRGRCATGIDEQVFMECLLDDLRAAKHRGWEP